MHTMPYTRSENYDTLLGFSIATNDWKIFKKVVENPQVYISSVRCMFSIRIINI